MITGSMFVCFMAYRWGMQERARIGTITISGEASYSAASDDPAVEALKRPEKFWINLALVVVLMTCLMMGVLPLAILFIIATALALLINYKNKDQQARIAANGANAMPVVAMVFAAGIFMGILANTKMIDAMSQMIIAGVPESMGPHFAFITALISLPGTFFMTNDAFYFGVLPVLAKAAAVYGIPADMMGRAALIGQGAHLLSPLVPSTYLLVGLCKVEFGDLQKFALIPSICVSLIWLATSVAMGTITL